MLTRKQKEEVINSLKKVLEENKLLVVADFRGLNVAKMQELKKLIRENNGNIQIVKKTLMNRALSEAEIKLDAKIFTGPLMFVFGTEEVGVSKVMWEFAKDNDGLKIEGGVLEGEVMDTENIEALAKLPGREELLAQTVFVIKSPMSGFAGVLRNTMGSFVNVLRAVAEKSN